MKDLVLRKCFKCNALIEVFEDCNCRDCGIMCCGENMKEVKANSVDASFEKHVPSYEVKDNEIVVTVNHVMDDDHFIEWIMVRTDDSSYIKKFKPGEVSSVTLPYKKGANLYSYCNKHGLWKSEVK